jgi:hypothetical protein
VVGYVSVYVYTYTYTTLIVYVYANLKRSFAYTYIQLGVNVYRGSYPSMGAIVSTSQNYDTEILVKC